MTVLQELDRYYGRMAVRGEAELPGYSREKISFVLALSPDGAVADVIDWRVQDGKRLLPQLVEVPALPGKRTVAVAPNLFWDKTAYVFGRTAGKDHRTGIEHAAFKRLHFDLLATSDDPGLVALRRFLEGWHPEAFDHPPFAADMLDTNFAFRLDGERRFLHKRDAARAIVAGRGGGDEPRGFCLVRGIEAPLRRLHPAVRGVDGGQSSGSPLVSFNHDAFASYGNEQGLNAPTSEEVAFRYGAALGRMLDRGSGNRLAQRVGDATVVFWADAEGVGEKAARQVEACFDDFFSPPALDPKSASLERDLAEARRVAEALEDLAKGRPNPLLDPAVSANVRFHVLGLAPNAGRISVRFWLSDHFGAFAAHLAEHYKDLAIDPPPWRGRPPGIARLLVKTAALQEKFDNIPVQLAGEMSRAVLAGTPYPRTLLSAALIRLRAGDDPSGGWHAAAIRAVLARAARRNDRAEEIPPVSLNPDYPDAAYQLGRMFAMAEIAQRMALGKVNATIRDRYFGAASATPAGVFPLLLRGMQSHLGKLRKDGKGGFIEREMDQIAGRLPPELPRSLRLDAQGRFVIGYYHQRRARIAGKPVEDLDADKADSEAGEGSENG